MDSVQYEGYGVDLGKMLRPQPPYSPESTAMDQLVSCFIQHELDFQAAGDWLDGVQIALSCNSHEWEMLFYIPSDHLSWFKTSSKRYEYNTKLAVALTHFLWFANNNGYVSDEYRENAIELLTLLIGDYADYGTWNDYI